ncbi:MAG: OmpA family protein [Polaribacter sp.]|uniref:OmpA family protein n=1 Tax=Polaribacter sp. TaxID=1920175 RepID=UPI003BB07054
MKNLTKNIFLAVLVLTITFTFTNCEATKNANNKQKGAVIGAAGGAILGAIIGNNVGNKNNSELGAVIGGVLGGTAGVLIGKRMDEQAKKIETEIPGAEVERVDDGIVVTFDENSGVYFDTNKADINPKSKVTLDKLANIFIEFKDTKILVVGHTDNTGKDDYNMMLSEKRAKSVTNYLVSDGISNSRFETLWYGETQPKYDNTTATGRAKNRRVNVAIIPNDKMKNEAIKDAQQ